MEQPFSAVKLTYFLRVPVYNRVGECPSPLLAARPMRRLSGIIPLHGAAHKKLPHQTMKRFVKWFFELLTRALISAVLLAVKIMHLNLI